MLEKRATRAQIPARLQLQFHPSNPRMDTFVRAPLPVLKSPSQKIYAAKTAHLKWPLLTATSLIMAKSVTAIPTAMAAKLPRCA